MSDGPEGIGALVVCTFVGREELFRLLNSALSMNVGEEYDFIEGTVRREAQVREASACGRASLCGVCSRIRIVELIVGHSFTLSRISDADAARVREAVGVACSIGPALVEPTVDASHHSASDHTDFVQEDEPRVPQVLL